MQVKFLATAYAPDYYEFKDETVIVGIEGKREEIDLSELRYGDRYDGIEFDSIEMYYPFVIRDIRRDESGILHLVLCQKATEGHWRESEWLGSNEYQKGKTYIKEISDGEAQENQ